MTDFLDSRRTESTKQTYKRYIKYFEDWYNKKLDTLLELDNGKEIQNILIKYAKYMRYDKKLKYDTLNVRCAPLISFLKHNDKIINTKKIQSYFGEHNKKKDKAYTREQIQFMFKRASFRTRLIIALYSSAGIRKGAIRDLKLKHIEKIQSHNICLYKFTVYDENAKEEYVTFCTPECASMIDEYIEQRRQAGEKITDESYLLRNDFNNLSPEKVRKPKAVTDESIARVLSEFLIRIGFRQVNHKTENYKYQRHDISLINGFRKYFESTLAKCKVNFTQMKLLTGHSIGVDDHYIRLEAQDLLPEYLKAVNELTINEENRLKVKVTELEQKQSEIDLMKYEHQREIKQIEDRLDNIVRKSYRQNATSIN